MKRSEMVAILEKDFEGMDINADTFLCNLEVVHGMKPPGVPVRLVRPKDWNWGGGCTIRCDCKDCNPNFIVHEWEPE